MPTQTTKNFENFHPRLQKILKRYRTRTGNKLAFSGRTERIIQTDEGLQENPTQTAETFENFQLRQLKILHFSIPDCIKV